MPSLSSDWKQLAALFQEAVELEPGERSAFLDRHCGDAPRLRRELEELLAADAGVEATWSGLTLGLGDAGEMPEGFSVPNYRIVRPLGEGGMGKVYLALRYDELFSGKPFAIKTLKVGGGDTHRFAEERRILSRLDHPYIARLYDGGRLPDATPYLVMDYVEGLPLDLYCREHRLSIDDRLKLFRNVCHAVHYAHQNLVVHRDIKPGNILVTADGAPRLLDFGIAKLLDPGGPASGGDSSDDMAAALLYPMTPEYASPEQFRGGSVTTASDVYSLGVVLYQLLTDRLPGRRPGAARLPPSAAVSGRNAASVARDRRLSPARLRRRLGGDLDDVVTKALRVEPEERYASVQALAEDIGKHLDVLPLSASRARYGYRAAKFVRRHRLRLLVAASLAAALALTLAAFVQSRRLGRTTAVLRQLAGPQADPLMDESFLDRVVEDIVELDATPRSKALLMEIVRRLYVSDEVLFHQVLETLGEEPRSPSQARDVADLSLSLGRLLFQKGWIERAEPVLRISLEKAEEAHGSETPALAPHLEELAAVIADLGAYDEAEIMLRRSLESRRRFLGDRHPVVAAVLHRLAEMLIGKGEYLEAASLLREALGIVRSGEAPDPLVIADQLNTLSLALMELGEYEEAEELAREALGLRRLHLGDEHYDVVQSVSNLATILGRKGDIEASIAIGEEAVALIEEVLGPDHVRLSHPLLGLGAAYRVLGKPDQCERYARRALALREVHLPEPHWLTALAESTLGLCLTDLGRYEEAGARLRASLAVLTRERGPGDHWTILTRERLDHLQRLENESLPNP